MAVTPAAAFLLGGRNGFAFRRGGFGNFVDVAAFAPLEEAGFLDGGAVFAEDQPHRVVQFHPGRVHGEDELPGGIKGVLVVFNDPRLPIHVVLKVIPDQGGDVFPLGG